LSEHLADEQLQSLVSGGMAQHEELLSLKGAMARADVFHILSGLWVSPAERCFLWLGGFRPSEVIKVYTNSLLIKYITIHLASYLYIIN
jgi:transcription factor TGA